MTRDEAMERALKLLLKMNRMSKAGFVQHDLRVEISRELLKASKRSAETLLELKRERKKREALVGKILQTIGVN